MTHITTISSCHSFFPLPETFFCSDSHGFDALNNILTLGTFWVVSSLRCDVDGEFVTRRSLDKLFVVQRVVTLCCSVRETLSHSEKKTNCQPGAIYRTSSPAAVSSSGTGVGFAVFISLVASLWATSCVGIFITLS